MFILSIKMLSPTVKLCICHPRFTDHPPALSPEMISTGFIRGHNPTSEETLKIQFQRMFPPIPIICMISWWRLHRLWNICLLPANTCFLLLAWLMLRLAFLCAKASRFENKGLEFSYTTLYHHRGKGVSSPSHRENWSSSSSVSLQHSKQLEEDSDSNPKLSVNKS